MRVIGDLHVVCNVSASHSIHDVSNAICDRIQRFIKWPNLEEIMRSKKNFYTYTNGFPFISEAVEGRPIHVPMDASFDPYNEVAFVNRKSYHPINVQILSRRALDCCIHFSFNIPTLSNATLSEHDFKSIKHRPSFFSKILFFNSVSFSRQTVFRSSNSNILLLIIPGYVTSTPPRLPFSRNIQLPSSPSFLLVRMPGGSATSFVLEYCTSIEHLCQVGTFST